MKTRRLMLCCGAVAMLLLLAPAVQAQTVLQVAPLQSNVWTIQEGKGPTLEYQHNGILPGKIFEVSGYVTNGNQFAITAAAQIKQFTISDITLVATNASGPVYTLAITLPAYGLKSTPKLAGIVTDIATGLDSDFSEVASAKAKPNAMKGLKLTP